MMTVVDNAPLHSAVQWHAALGILRAQIAASVLGRGKSTERKEETALRRRQASDVTGEEGGCYKKQRGSGPGRPSLEARPTGAHTLEPIHQQLVNQQPVHLQPVSIPALLPFTLRTTRKRTMSIEP